MARSRTRKMWNSKVLLLALVTGLTTLAVAVGVQVLLPGWTHAQQGGVVGGWMIFCICLAPIVARRTREVPSDGAEHRRVP